MSNSAIWYREQDFIRQEGFRDSSGQSHFPDKKLDSSEIDRVKLGKAGGYYPKMGEKK
jgi:hypothetical protein